MLVGDAEYPTQVGWPHMQWLLLNAFIFNFYIFFIYFLYFFIFFTIIKMVNQEISIAGGVIY